MFFSTACHHEWYQSLILPYGGYLNLPANLGADIACHLTPLQFAPYATIAIAFLFQALPAVLIATSKDHWLNNRLIMAAAMIAFTTAPMTDEVWLNTLQSQVFLTLSCGLILAMSTSDKSVEWLRRAALLVAPLSGCTSVMLVPFFVMRAFAERSKQRVIQAGCILAGSILQVMFFVLPYLRSEPSRFAGIDPWLLLTVFFNKNILLPLAANDGAVYSEILRRSFLAHAPDIVPLIASTLYLITLCVMASRCKAPVAWLVLPGAALALMSYTCSLNPKTDLLYLFDGIRYAYAGQMLITVAYLALVKLGSLRTKLICAVLSGWLLFVGICHYRHADPAFKYGPSWPAQIEAWRKDHSKIVGGWPANWSFNLDPSRVH